MQETSIPSIFPLLEKSWIEKNPPHKECCHHFRIQNNANQ